MGRRAIDHPRVVARGESFMALQEKSVEVKVS